MSDPIEVRRHDRLLEIGAEAWDALLARAPGATIFQGYGWNSSWWDTQATEDRRLLLLSAWRRGFLVGIAPLQILTGERGAPQALHVRGRL